MTKNTTQITVETESGGMGDGWIDDQTANRTYAEWLSGKLEAVYPDATITVLPVNQCGSASPVVTSDDPSTNTDAIAERVQSLCQEYWGEFCGIATEEFPELVSDDSDSVEIAPGVYQANDGTVFYAGK